MGANLLLTNQPMSKTKLKLDSGNVDREREKTYNQNKNKKMGKKSKTLKFGVRLAIII